MGAKGWGVSFGWLYILATAVTAAPSIAQTVPPPAAQSPAKASAQSPPQAAAQSLSQAVAQSPSQAAAPKAQGKVPEGCSIPTRSDVPAASIVQATGESLQRKRWQPRGGAIQFTVKSFASIPDKASFFVCFRWKTTPANTEQFDESPIVRLDRNNDGTTWTVVTTVPHLRTVPTGAVVETAVPLVPLADVRIVALKEDKTPAADVTTTIGITYRWAAISFSVAAILIALVALNIFAQLRLKHEGIKSAFWFLRIISTPGGYASLSQLQIVLWTLVVAASAVYVMSLSGDLIEVTNGTLVLLGIAGATAVGAKAHSESQYSAAQDAAAKAQQEADKAKIEAARKAAAVSVAPEIPVATVEKDVADKAKTEAASKATTAKARADAIKDPPPSQTPQWSDLIVSETTKIDGTKVREIDVTRFQMLLFTLITAAFVLMNVLTTYVIPEIPTGFLTLMGISNGVYLGAKVTQSSNAKT
jgi:hypothetical protein